MPRPADGWHQVLVPVPVTGHTRGYAVDKACPLPFGASRGKSNSVTGENPLGPLFVGHAQGSELPSVLGQSSRGQSLVPVG